MPTSASSSSLSSMTVSAPLSPRPPLAAQLVQRQHHPNLGPIKQAPLNTNTKNTMAVTWRHTSVQVWAESRAVPLHMVFAPTEGDACQEAALDPVSTTVAIAHMDMLDHHHHQPQVTLSTSNAPPVGPVAEKDIMLAAIVSTSPSRTPSATADWSQPLCARNVTRPGTHHVVPLPWGTQCVRVEYWPVMTNAGANHAVVNGQHQRGGHVQGLKCAQTMPVHVVLISFGPPPPPSSSVAAAMPAPASSSSSSSSLVRSHSNSKLALSSSSDSTVFLRPTTPASAFTSARRTHANMQLTRASPFSPRPPSPKAPNVLLSRDAYVHNRRGVPLPMIPPSMLGLATWMPPPPGAPRPALKLKMLTNHTTASTGDTDADDDAIGSVQDDESMGAAGQLVALNPDAPYWSRAGGGTWRPWSVSPHPSTVHSFETDAAEAGGGGAGTLFASEHEYMQAMAKAMAGADADAHETEAGAAGSIEPSDEDLAMFQRYLMASQEPSELPAPPALASVLSRDVMSSSASLGASTASPRVRHLGINRAFPPPSSATPNGSPVELSMNATPPNPGTGAFASPPGADAAYSQFADEQQQQQHQHQPRYAWMHPEHPPQYKYPPPAPTSAVSSPSMYNEFGGLTRRQAQQHRYRPYPSFAGPRSAGAREAQPMQH